MRRQESEGLAAADRPMIGMEQGRHDIPKLCSPQRIATAIATCNLRAGPLLLIRHESLRTSLNDCGYAEVVLWLAPHLEFLSLGGPSMRPSTFVSSTSRSALSSLPAPWQGCHCLGIHLTCPAHCLVPLIETGLLERSDIESAALMFVPTGRNASILQPQASAC